MGRLIDCQMAIVTWGDKARFRQGKVGLFRRRSAVYLAILFANETHKFALDRHTIELLPAAMRFKEIQKDLFIRRAMDEDKYKNLLRSIKVLIRSDAIRRSGRGNKLDQLIADLPHIDSITSDDLNPAKLSTSMGVKRTNYINNSGSRPIEFGDAGFVTATMLDSGDVKELKRRLDTYQHLQSVKTIGLPNIPENLWLADSLNRLALIECNLAFVPKQLETLSRSLQYLDLSKNSINKLPRTFCCKMNNLRYLNLSHNAIETLPLEIKFFSRLVDLDISNNNLRLLPTTFSDLRSLKTLNVASNNLSQLPAFRKEDIRLEILDISSNPLDGALDKISTFEVYPSYEDNPLGYEETTFSPFASTKLSTMTSKFPTLFEISLLNIVRSDFLFKLASEESLPKSIISTMQRDIFKCYRCNEMNMLPAYNSTDYLDYVEQVSNLITTRNYRTGMTFMKLLCRKCFSH